MGSKASIQLQDEDINRFHEETGCKYTVSLKVPPTHRPYHRPTWSVMRSVSDGRWVDVVEGALLQGRLAAGG